MKIINNPSLPISPFQVSKELFSHMNDTALAEMMKQVCFSINQVDDIFDVIIKYLNEEA